MEDEVEGRLRCSWLGGSLKAKLEWELNVYVLRRGFGKGDGVEM